MAVPPPHTLETHVNVYFDRAARLGGHPAGLVDQIRACNTVCTFQFPVRRADGSIEVVRAWRAEHSHHKLPTKGPAAQDLRTAAFLNAIDKVARSYLELGIFP